MHTTDGVLSICPLLDAVIPAILLQSRPFVSISLFSCLAYTAISSDFQSRDMFTDLESWCAVYGVSEQSGKCPVKYYRTSRTRINGRV
jgi:hypothetical protein